MTENEKIVKRIGELLRNADTEQAASLIERVKQVGALSEKWQDEFEEFIALFDLIERTNSQIEKADSLLRKGDLTSAPDVIDSVYHGAKTLSDSLEREQANYYFKQWDRINVILTAKLFALLDARKREVSL